MHHAEQPDGPVAAAQNCATHGPLSVVTRDGRCTAWSSMRRFDIDRRTVKKMLSYSAPLGYRRTKPVRRPKLDRVPGRIEPVLPQIVRAQQ